MITFKNHEYSSFDLNDNILALTTDDDKKPLIHIYESNSVTGIFNETFHSTNFDSETEITVTTDFVIVHPLGVNDDINFYFEKRNGKWQGYQDKSYPNKYSVAYTPNTGALVGYVNDDYNYEVYVFKYKYYILCMLLISSGKSNLCMGNIK